MTVVILYLILCYLAGIPALITGIKDLISVNDGQVSGYVFLPVLLYLFVPISIPIKWGRKNINFLD